MEKRFAQLHTSALDSHVPPIHIYKTKTMHIGHGDSSSLRHVNHYLIRKKKIPSNAIGKKKLTSFPVPFPDVQLFHEI